MNWKKVKLGDVCEFLSGFAWSAKNFKDVGKMPIIRIQNMCSTKPDDFIYWDEKYDEKFIIKTNDLLLSLSGSIKLDYWKGVDALLNQRIVKISTNSSINDRWFFWQIQNELKRIERMGKWALVNNVSLTDLRNLEIPLPDLTTQQHIAKVLDQADALRQQNRQLLAHYDELLQSTFIDLFGDPVKNEKGWEVKKLGDILEFMTSGSRGWAEYYATSGSLFLRIQNIGYNKLKMNEIAFVNAPDTAESKRTRVQGGDILVSITADLGRTAVIPENLGEAYISQHLALLRLKDNINSIFISELLASEFGQRQFKSANKGGVKAGLNFNDIKSINILLPSFLLQQQFAQIVEQIEEQKAVVKQSLAESEVLFEGLLAEYFG